MIDKHNIALFISVLSVSFAAIFIVTINQNTHPLSIAFYRLFFTTLMITPFVILNNKSRSELFNLSIRFFIILSIIGLILGIHFALWITSLVYTTVASSVILVTIHPIIVGPLSHYLLKERLNIKNVIGILISLFGVILLVYGNYGIDTLFFFSKNEMFFGNILALLGGLAAGLYILGGRIVRKKISILTYAFVVYGIATIILFFICIILRVSIIDISLNDFGLILLMALISGILGHTLYNWTLEYIRASLASVFLLGEPICSAFLAYIIPWISQVPSVYTILGGGIIIIGIYLTSRIDINLNTNKY